MSLSLTVSRTQSGSTISQTTRFHDYAIRGSFLKDVFDCERNSANSLSHKDVIEFHSLTELEPDKHRILTEKAKMNLKPQSPSTCYDYQTMCREENDLIQEPEWDSSEQCLMRDMMASKWTLFYAQELLDSTRTEYLHTIQKQRHEIEQLKRDEHEFGASIIYYDNFVNDNVEKRQRALEKVFVESAIQLDIEEQILQTEEKIKKMTEIKEDMLKYIDDRKKFVDFLENARLVTQEQFPNGVQDIVERFELLLSVREKLAIQQEHTVRTMQELSNKVFHITDERTEELINLRNKVTELRCRLDVAKHDALYWELVVNRVEEVIAQQSRHLNITRAACWGLYLQICKQYQIPVAAKRDEVPKQLSLIEETIKVMRRALFLIKKKFHKQVPQSTSYLSFTKQKTLM